MSFFQPCENCIELPILLVGTKSDLWRERQVRAEAGHAAAKQVRGIDNWNARIDNINAQI